VNSVESSNSGGLKPYEESLARFGMNSAVRGLRVLWCIAALAVFAGAYGRYHNFNNETFDLAFYARMAWGLSGGDFWDPIVGSNVLGLHISPVLVPLGLVGRLVGTVEVLLAAQSLIATAAIFPLAQLGHDLFGKRGAWFGALAFLVYPGLFPVMTGEFHPGTLALLPLSVGILAMHRQDARGLAWATLGVACCREDLLLITAIMALMLAWKNPASRRTSLWVFTASAVYVAIFLFILHPMLGPTRGSLDAHFGPWGASTGGVLLHLLTHPLQVAAHLLAGERLMYLVAVFAPLGFLSLRSPFWLLPVLPVFAINLLSHFPAAIRADDHYLSPAIPFLVAAALFAFRRVDSRMQAVALCVAAVSTLVGWTSYQRFSDYFESEQTALSREITAAIDPEVQVQAPYELLPHLAERDLLHRAPPPDHGGGAVVLPVRYRQRYQGRESLIRTEEEPIVRNWLARPGFGAVAANTSYILLRRGADPRSGAAARFFTEGREGQPQRLTGCLSVTGAVRRAGSNRVRLFLRAHGPCPHDLALRIGFGYRPRRVELLFDGVLSPAWLRLGDELISDHGLPDGFRGSDLRVGLLRSSGTRPEHEDPVAVTVNLEEAP